MKHFPYQSKQDNRITEEINENIASSGRVLHGMHIRRIGASHTYKYTNTDRWTDRCPEKQRYRHKYIPEGRTERIEIFHQTVKHMFLLTFTRNLNADYLDI